MMVLKKRTDTIKGFGYKQNTLPETKPELNYYPQLNGLRFLFVLMVLLHHWGPENLFERFRVGWLGVDLFFVLSGFLIGEILLLEKAKTKNRALSIRNFITRRALRIFPLYYLTIFIYAAFVTTGGIFIWNVTYTNNILQFIDVSRVSKEFWHLWSLCVEEQFYLLFPLLVFFVPRKAFLVVVISCIFFSVIGRFVQTYSEKSILSYTLMPFCLDSLLTGVLLAYVKTHRPDILKKIAVYKNIIFPVIFFLAISAFLISFINNRLAVYTLFGFAGSLLGLFVIGYSVTVGYKGAVKIFLENRFISLFGKISYGIYLLHPFVEKFYYTNLDNSSIKNFLIHLNEPVISNRFVIVG